MELKLRLSLCNTVWADSFMLIFQMKQAKVKQNSFVKSKEGKERQQGRSFLSQIRAGIRLSGITASHNSNPRKKGEEESK